MNSTALFIDPTDRQNMPVSTVSVTEVPGKGLVLRFGAEVGNLADLAGQFIDLPVIVATRGWSARSSAGFVSINCALPKQTVIGLQGMPWFKGGKGLRLLGCPMEVVIVGGAEIRRIATHADGHYNSNWASASAADAALAIRGRINAFGVIISEGQSDYTHAWELRPLRTPQCDQWGNYASTPAMEWPVEHRLDRFTDEEVVKKVLRRVSTRRDEETGETVLDEQLLVKNTAILAAAVAEDSLESAQAQLWGFPAVYWPTVKAGMTIGMVIAAEVQGQEAPSRVDYGAIGEED